MSNISAASCRCGLRKSSNWSRRIGAVRLPDYLRAGVFLSGVVRGSAIALLAEKVMQMPVSLGRPFCQRPEIALDQPEFVSAIGLVKFGSFKNRKREGRPSLAQGIKSTITSFLRRS